MNNQSPLVPQGTFQEQRNKGRARVKIAVFVVLAIHGIGLLALLMQGCKKEPDTSATGTSDSTNTAAIPTFAEPTNAPLGSNTIAASTNVNTPPEPVTSPMTLATATEYKVAKGDTYGIIAKKFSVSVKALTDANPGVDPKKLQIGQTLHVPAPTAAASSSTAGTSAAAATTLAEGQIYSVQSGDTLIGIASKFGVTVKALRSANNLTTDKIRVGQKLKIPAKTTAPLTAGSNTSSTTPSGQ